MSLERKRENMKLVISLAGDIRQFVIRQLNQVETLELMAAAVVRGE
jgi:hypothetical protein